jgi:hypothetical protein
MPIICAIFQPYNGFWPIHSGWATHLGAIPVRDRKSIHDRMANDVRDNTRAQGMTWPRGRYAGVQQYPRHHPPCRIWLSMRCPRQAPHGPRFQRPRHGVSKASGRTGNTASGPDTRSGSERLVPIGGLHRRFVRPARQRRPRSESALSQFAQLQNASTTGAE